MYAVFLLPGTSHSCNIGTYSVIQRIVLRFNMNYPCVMVEKIDKFIWTFLNQILSASNNTIKNRKKTKAKILND